jgi:hypothetical protein
MKLPSGKKVKLKTPTIEELEKFNLFGVINSAIFDKHIAVGKCKQCGYDITLDDVEYCV